MALVLVLGVPLGSRAGGRVGRRRRAAAPAPPGRRRRGVRVCVVGCGAVGSLFAANLARLEDVEVWAYDLAARHVRAINERGLRLIGADEVLGRPRATSDAAELPPATSASSRRRRCTRRPRPRPRTRSGRRRPRSRTGSATRRRSRGTSSGDPRDDVPGGDPRAGRRSGTSRATRRSALRAAAGLGGEIERLADACTRAGCRPRRSRTRAAAVAQGDLQRRDEPDRRAHRPDPRPRLRAADLRDSSALVDEGRPSPPHRGSSLTPTPRS